MRAPAGNWPPALVLVLALAAAPATSQEFTATAGMVVRIEIAANCMVSAADLDFGAYASNSKSPSRGQTAVQLHCSPGAVVELSLDAGMGPGRNTSRRRLAQDSGVDRLDYDLFQDSARTIHWGDRSGTDTREVATTGAPQSVPVYGEIPAGQRAQDGTYSDTITVRVLY
jgi:spore coat protein U-like protein